MTTQMTIDSDQVLTIASQIENDNKELQTLLSESKTTMDNLASFWSGKASDATRASYDAFASKYFQQYHDVLNQYVKFLRNNVASQYEQTEQVNTQLADAFK